jgi:uncharacterized protein (DUF427 family)
MARKVWKWEPTGRWVRTTCGIETNENAVLTYPDPIDEAPKLKDRISF